MVVELVKKVNQKVRDRVDNIREGLEQDHVMHFDHVVNGNLAIMGSSKYCLNRGAPWVEHKDKFMRVWRGVRWYLDKIENDEEFRRVECLNSDEYCSGSRDWNDYIG
jgi:hypothetical protein